MNRKQCDESKCRRQHCRYNYYSRQYHDDNQIYCCSSHGGKQFRVRSDKGITSSIYDRHYRYSIDNCSQYGAQNHTYLQREKFDKSEKNENVELVGFANTINRTALPVPMYRAARIHVGVYGSFSRVTGFVRNVFTDASNSGRFSSSLSMFCKSHSHLITDCLRFHSSRNVVAKFGIGNQ